MGQSGSQAHAGSARLHPTRLEKLSFLNLLDAFVMLLDPSISEELPDPGQAETRELQGRGMEEKRRGRSKTMWRSCAALERGT